MHQIFVGDVQGCAEELEILLKRAEETFGQDFEIWLAGDLVNRGPLSLRALKRIRPLVEAGRARYVLGNHELKIIGTGLGVRPSHPTDTFGDVLAAPDCDEWVEWLRRRPLLETAKIGNQKVAMAHASVHPDWNFETLIAKADAVERRLGHEDAEETKNLLVAERSLDPDKDLLDRMTSARSVRHDGAWSKQEPETAEDAWHSRWIAKQHDYGVVYGHWARQGLHVAPGVRGLDTGCVHHGRGRDGFLTAWVPDLDAENFFEVPDESFWQIPALRRYRRD